MRRLGLLALVLVVCSACGAGPSNRPHVAVEREGGGSEPTPTESQNADAPPPQLQVPKTDLTWTDCTQGTLETLGPGVVAPSGLIFECASYESAVDESGVLPGSFTMGAMRARLADTPANAAPLVLTSGSDRSSTSTLAALSTGGLATLLSTRPVVAVDRRGIASSQKIECLSPPTSDLRRRLADLGQFDPGAGDQVDKVAALGRDATIACTDYLQPQELAFDSTHAADDIETLRRTWEVDSLGILATGNGSAVALSYAAEYPGRVGRLVLDSPAVTTVDAATVTEQQVAGQEAAFDAFARQCTALSCSLGPDPRAAVTAAVAAAAAGRIPGVSSNALLTAISGVLGTAGGDQQGRVRMLSDAVSAATAGNTAPLLALAAQAEAAYESDGQFITRCTDGQQWPAPDRVRQLQRVWGEQFPLFGPDAAVGLLLCTSWPATAPPALPGDLSMPVLVLSGAADPVVGNAGVGTVTGAVGSAGATTATLTWHGRGHPATHSDCSQKAIVSYLADGTLPPDGSACPA
ncbi:alpha/beta hydrolase [Rhodococcus oxybenzonivorans]|uniref:alpha/beta hydrolase n=1 Tax=Rhodococcus oxybenzonivorans TaxID=1990687 RepID=UPI002954D879|nr:alpha/beta hydrolase [Rhodococcus oxybenzonivorans]MDV7352241.1 alpha/beta hydrolase [Rhodococcus oxybenzonivorans]